MGTETTHSSLFWDMIAGRYDRQSKKFDETYARTIQKTLPYLTSNDHILDIACGTGIVTIELASHVSSITAIDTSPNMISICKTKASERSIHNIECLHNDLFSLQSKKYDAILLMNVLHFIRDIDPFLERAVSLCKDGGYIITATDCLAESSGIGDNLVVGIQRLFSLIGLIPRMHFFTSEELIDGLSEYGLSPVENDIIHPSPANLFAVFQKK